MARTQQLWEGLIVGWFAPQFAPAAQAVKVGRQATAVTATFDIMCCAVLCSSVTALLQVHVVKRDGSNQLLQTYDTKPSYAELEAALKTYPEAASNKSLMDRIRDEVQFIQDTAQQPGQKKD